MRPMTSFCRSAAGASSRRKGWQSRRSGRILVRCTRIVKVTSLIRSGAARSAAARPCGDGRSGTASAMTMWTPAFPCDLMMPPKPRPWMRYSVASPVRCRARVLMTDRPVDLDHYRGMAAQKATEARRLLPRSGPMKKRFTSADMSWKPISSPRRHRIGRKPPRKRIICSAFLPRRLRVKILASRR
jgi:hypothetical protein